MIGKLLIANRGEIAVRVIGACRELGIESIAVYSDADQGALHVQLADRAVRIGPAAATDSYLNQDAIVAAASETGADAVHPGYGFLSENAAFAERCGEAGLLFVGPTPGVIRLMGDKAAAKQLAREAGVPVVPGYDGADQSDERLAAEAQIIGMPILIKPVGGGGGKGMRAVYDLARLAEELAGARREARAAFGDERLLLERLLERPRHIEIQIAGDQHGTLIALGERECSIQRRHQKVIEESPSPAVTESLRARMSALAVGIARASGYTSVGTVEFLLDSDGAVYFLEMNTRLQVEHAVTEAVYGLDLVRLQLDIAQGKPLAFDVETRHASPLQPLGHAIECRIYAEDPDAGFLPSTGRIHHFRVPEGPGVRNDIGTYAGDTVTPYYDPLLAKLTVHAENRDAAIARLSAALAGYSVLGVHTNLPALRDVVVHPAFARGEIDIGFLERELSVRDAASAPPIALFAASAAELLQTQRGVNGRGSWDALGPWRAGGQALPFRWRADGQPRLVVATRLATAAGAWRFSTDDVEFSGAIRIGAEGTVILQAGDQVSRFDIARSPEGAWVGHDGRAWLLVRDGPPSLAGRGHAAGQAGDHAITAPMPGIVTKVNVSEGDEVSAHQVLLVLEAMKMEHTIEAPAAGRVRRLHFSAGAMVTAGAMLVELEQGG